MNALIKPKSLPWLARRAGVPAQVADALWNKALKLAGNGNTAVAEPRRQAEAMRYLLLMLGSGTIDAGCHAGCQAPADAAVCQ